MFSEKDIQQIKRRGSNPEEVAQQIAHFKKGFPWLPVVEAASPGNGIEQVSEQEIRSLVQLFLEKAASGIQIMKFVPASGAASRMFKSLFSALDELNAGKSEDQVLEGNKDTREFLERLDDFAFSEELKTAVRRAGKDPGLYNLLDFLLTPPLSCI